MEEKRIHNFNPGPAALPLPVLKEIQDSFLNFKGSGMSIIEISHRSPLFEEVLGDAIERTKRLLHLDDQYQVLFIQGGASLQFCMVPMNFIKVNESADYVNTGTWATKAIKEAQVLGKSVQVVASSEDRDYSYIPEDIQFNPDASYVHLTSNNTIKGTQWSKYPDTGGVPVIADMSSDFMSRPLDPSPFGMIYGGIQKNLGAAGVCLVILRKDMLDRIPEGLPAMLSYQTYASKNSLFNTPPCFAIYTVQLVLKWLEDTMGGLDRMSVINQRKAALIYEVLDSGDFYKGTVESGSRSLMNVTFRLPDRDLEKKFLDEAIKNDFTGLKGHRAVGGCRASIYNAVELSAVQALTDFMKTFAKKHG
ncbi:MAG TPA: 3-phosphoserine/phosphohydroxythreonine transaminase [Deltaproteobacteria bacterium]|nr:3-phosphoserine/phosphohydroxythreonine transaminase [Deltaproteobacteria bacterium]